MEIEGRVFKSVGSEENIANEPTYAEQTKVSQCIKDAKQLYDGITSLDGFFRSDITRLQEMVQQMGDYTPSTEIQEYIAELTTASFENTKNVTTQNFLQRKSHHMVQKLLFHDFLQQSLPEELFNKLMQTSVAAKNKNHIGQVRRTFLSETVPLILTAIKDRWGELEDELDPEDTLELPAVDYTPKKTSSNKNKET